jgi:hypothetical protein
MTEHEAVRRFCTTSSEALKTAFRRGFRVQRAGGERSRARNPYERYRLTSGWGNRYWRQWDEGWRIAYVYPEVREEIISGIRS